MKTDKHITPTTCRDCGNTFAGTYCNVCGEKKYSEHDKAIPHLIGELFHFFTHFEGNFFTTVKSMFLSPGKVSLDQSNGIRKKYYKPIYLYLLLIVIYLLLPHAFPQGLKPELDAYVSKSHQTYYMRIIDHKMQRKHILLAEMEEHYRHVSEKISEPLLVIFLPMCALVLMSLYPRCKKVFYDHFMLSTELNSFTLIFIFLLLPLFLCLFLPFPSIRSFLYKETTLTTLGVTGVLIYITVALRRFYNSSWLLSAGKAGIYVALYFVVEMIYKFIAFNVIMLLV